MSDKEKNASDYLKSSMFKYDSKLKSTLFYGINTINDLNIFMNHTGSKFIYWNFCNDDILNNILIKLKDVKIHFCNNEKILKILLKRININQIEFLNNSKNSEYILLFLIKFIKNNNISQIYISVGIRNNLSCLL